MDTKKKYSWKTAPKALIWIIGTVVVLALVLFVGTYFADRPLTKYMQGEINRNLKGYSVTVENAHFQPIGLDLALKGVTIRQSANPEPPVAYFPVFEASLHWKPLIHGRVVGELNLDKPKLYINLKQLQHEEKKKFAVKEEGWQRALEAIYPLKINQIKIDEGDITYIDQDPNRPLHLTKLNVKGNNIRNIEKPEAPYPSPLHVDGIIFGRGSLTMDGHANFLEEPFAGIKVDYGLSGVPLQDLGPVLARKNLQISGGLISSSGELEYSPNVKTAHVKLLGISGVRLDYLHTPATAEVEHERVEKVKEVAKAAENKPGLLARIDKLQIDGSEFGYVDQTKRNPYRAYLSGVSLTVMNLSNHFTEGTANIQIRGKFMGNGPTAASAAFRPDVKGPDFDLKVTIDDTQLKSMDNILRAYGNFDVSGGLFSLNADVHIKNNEITGSIKPFFKDMEVYDNRKPEEKNLFHSLYVQIVGGLSKFLKNPSSKAVATEVTLSGEAGQPQISTWEIIVNLVKNAFFHAILPGFEKEASKKPGAGQDTKKPGAVQDTQPQQQKPASQER